jgi:hypothetical protein
MKATIASISEGLKRSPHEGIDVSGIPIVTIWIAAASLVTFSKKD